MCVLSCVNLLIGKCKIISEEKLSSATSEISEQKKRCQGLQESIRVTTDQLQLIKNDIQNTVVVLKMVETKNKTIKTRKVLLFACL